MKLGNSESHIRELQPVACPVLLIMSGLNETPFKPRRIFTSGGAEGDHEQDFAVAGAWNPRCYGCSFCGREFNSAQALGGHMNIHRRDRALLRTTTAPSSAAHRTDLPPALHKNAKSSQRTLFTPLEEACRGNLISISTSLNAYTAPSIMSTTTTLEPLVMRSAAERTLLSMAAPPLHDDHSPVSVSMPLSHLVSFRFGSTGSSSASRFSEIQNQARSLSPNTAQQASSMLLTPILLEYPSFKPAGSSLNVYAGAGQASIRQCGQCERNGTKAGAGYGMALQFEQCSQAKGHHKRTRGQDLSEGKHTMHCCAGRQSTSVSSTESSNSHLHTAVENRTYDLHKDCKEHDCLDLELRLGHSSSARSAITTTCGLQLGFSL